jgi:hypothetical protein
VTQIKQEVEEAPAAFLKRLRKPLIKHTNLNPDTYEGQLILKEFITQSAPDIHKKLQKFPRGPEDTLDNLLNWLLGCSTLERRRNYRPGSEV